jgi:hypothetical protein
MNKSWTPEQEEALREYWVKKCNLKNYLHLFGDRSYKAILSHAKKRMKLGPRPQSARGVPAYAWDWIKAELLKSPGTSSDLVMRTGLVTSAVCRNLRDARLSGQAHIMEWRKRSNGGRPTPVYAIGPGESAEKPAPFTIREKNQRVRQRKQLKSNPFSIAIQQVTTPTVVTLSTRGRYEKRVIQQEAA